jgi:biopolymer transport protein ExbB/TolQ
VDPSGINSTIHSISTLLETPAIIVLIIAVVISASELGSAVIEFFAFRLGRNPDAGRVLKEIYSKEPGEQRKAIKAEPFLKTQRIVFEKLITSKESELPSGERKLLAIQLLAEEEARMEKIMQVTDIIARIAPMFGLMATLIPLGPGLIALGRGDTKGLADSLLTAFDATVTGLAAAGVAYIVSRVRKRWYRKDMATLEAVMEGLLE